MASARLARHSDNARRAPDLTVPDGNGSYTVYGDRGSAVMLPNASGGYDAYGSHGSAVIVPNTSGGYNTYDTTPGIVTTRSWSRTSTHRSQLSVIGRHLGRTTVEIKTSPITALPRLLAEYHDTCERILDEQEIEVGLWAYKKRTPGLRRSAAFYRF